MIAVIVLVMMTAMGTYTALFGRRKLNRIDYAINLVMLFCAASCLVLQVLP